MNELFDLWFQNKLKLMQIYFKDKIHTSKAPSTSPLPESPTSVMCPVQVKELEPLQ